jgi:flagellar basal-body rod protein FlgC
MNYLHAFAISASGMAVEKARVDVTAVNLANANSTRSADGTAFRPLRVVSAARAPEFAGLFERALRGAQVVDVKALETAPRLAYEPGHPDADDKGFVAYPGINPVSEMMNLLTAVRIYEANVAALGAAKAMALRTLELGG